MAESPPGADWHPSILPLASVRPLVGSRLLRAVVRGGLLVTSRSAPAVAVQVVRFESVAAHVESPGLG